LQPDLIPGNKALVMAAIRSIVDIAKISILVIVTGFDNLASEVIIAIVVPRSDTLDS
jgi:hypothetical protein